MVRSRWLWSLWVLCILGCSQKEPGEGSHASADAGDPPGDTPVAPVTMDYYPLVAGSTLTYRHSGGSSEWDDRTTVTATQYMGEDAFIIQGAADPKGEASKNIITRDGTRIYRAYKEDIRASNVTGSVEYVPGFIRFDAAWADAAEGFSEDVAYTRIEKTATGNTIAEDDREHTYTVEKKNETVQVAAGTIDDCIRVRRVRVRGSMSTNSSDDDDKVFWFCAGIGKVREESVLGGNVEELLDCEIPGGSCP